MKEGTRKLLDKAERAIRAAQTLLDAADAEFAAGRTYYAMFYVAEALLYERNLQFSKHSAVHAAYGKEFAKTDLLNPQFHRWLLEAFNTRLQMDYGFDGIVSEEEVAAMVEQARSFLVAAHEFLNTPADPSVSPDEAAAEDLPEPPEVTTK